MSRRSWAGPCHAGSSRDPNGWQGGLVAKHSTGIRAPRALVPFMPLEKPLQLAKIISGRCSRLKSRIAWAVLKAESGNQTCPACWIIWKRRQAASLRPVSALPGTLCRQVSGTRCVRAGRKQAERKHARFHQDLRRIRTCQKGYAKLFCPVSLPASLLHALPLPLSGTEVSPRTFASESGLAGSAGMVTSTERVSTAMTPTGRPPSLRQGRASQQGPVPLHAAAPLHQRCSPHNQPHGHRALARSCACGLPAPGLGRGWKPPLRPAVPRSANHDRLSPRPHDLLEASLVKEAALPRPLESCRAKGKEE